MVMRTVLKNQPYFSIQIKHSFAGFQILFVGINWVKKNSNNFQCEKQFFFGSKQKGFVSKPKVFEVFTVFSLALEIF